MSKMSKAEITEFANEMIAEFDLDVPIKWSNAKGYLGRAEMMIYHFPTRIEPIALRLSWALLQTVDDQDYIYEIVLHEISHFIANLRHADNCKHDHRWAAVCKEMGIPARTRVHAANYAEVKYKYTARCPHGCKFNFDRLTQKWRRGGWTCKHQEELKITQNY